MIHCPISHSKAILNRFQLTIEYNMCFTNSLICIFVTKFLLYFQLVAQRMELTCVLMVINAILIVMELLTVMMPPTSKDAVSIREGGCDEKGRGRAWGGRGLKCCICRAVETPLSSITVIYTYKPPHFSLFLNSESTLKGNINPNKHHQFPCDFTIIMFIKTVA